MMSRTLSARRLVALALVAACGGDDGGASVDAAPDADTSPAALCRALELPVRPFADGPYGVHRGEVADDFTVPILGGGTWNLRAQWSGCETYVFVPDTIATASNDPTSIWAPAPPTSWCRRTS